MVDTSDYPFPPKAVTTPNWPMGPKEAGLEFVELSHPWGLGQPCWPYFEDVKIERLHSMSKSRVLTQRITTVMHSGTHLDVPAHVVEGTPYLHEIPLQQFFGTGVVVSIPKQMGRHHRRRSGKGDAEDHAGRHRDGEHGLAQILRRQRAILRVLAGLL